MTVRELMVRLGFNVDRNSESNAQNSINGLKNFATKALGAVGLAFSVTGLKSVISSCVEASSEVEEMQNKFDVVFQGMTDDVEKWADTYADSIGRNSNVIKSYLADEQNLLVGMGMERDQGAALSEQMTSLALDLASFNNIGEDEAINAMTKALMGETESAKTLGAVLNDNTRAQAMQNLGLTGTYEKLDEVSKMQVNYQAILNQSADAVGDCERSVDSYKGTQLQLHAVLQNIKENVGQFFMPAIKEINKMIIPMAKKFRDLITSLKGTDDESNVLVQGINKVKSIFEEIKPTISSVANSVGNAVRSAVGFISMIIDRLGGLDNIIRIVATAIPLIMGFMKMNKIIGVIKGIGAAVSGLNYKMMAIAAIIVLLVLAVDDFINFMQGNDSVLGTIFDKMGIDADQVRQTIINAWNSVTQFLSQAWSFISGVASSIWGGLQQFWANHGEQVKQILLGAWNIIQTVLGTVFSAIASVAMAIFNALQSFWNSWGSTIIGVFQTIWTTLGNLVQPFMDILQGLITFIQGVFSGNWSQAWNGIVQAFTGIWNGAVAIIQGILNVIQTIFTGIWNNISSAVTSIWDSMVNAVTSKVSAIGQAIQNGFQSAISFITSLPAQAIKWGSDIIDGIVNGIKGAIGKVGDAVAGVANKIKSYLHFSVPDEGPLTDYESWMPDFMGGLATGIKTNIPKVTDGVKQAAGAISRMGNVKADTATVNNAVGTSGGSTSSVVQNNTVTNTFQGTDRNTMVQASKQMDKTSDDFTDKLAKGLEYCR